MSINRYPFNNSISINSSALYCLLHFLSPAWAFLNHLPKVSFVHSWSSRRQNTRFRKLNNSLFVKILNFFNSKTFPGCESIVIEHMRVFFSFKLSKTFPKPLFFPYINTDGLMKIKLLNGNTYYKIIHNKPGTHKDTEKDIILVS